MKGVTHSDVFVAAIDLLEKKDNRGYVVEFLETLAEIGSFGKNADWKKDTWTYYVRQPDAKPENGGESAGGMHYYIPSSVKKSKAGEYYMNNNGDFTRSARTKMEDHYSSALNAWHNGDKANAAKYLGFAVHYLTDIGTVPHVVGITHMNSFSEHAGFETFVNNNFSEYSKIYDAERKYGSFADGFGYTLNGLANVSIAFKKNVNLVFPFFTFRNKTKRYGPAVSATLPLIIKYVAALLDQFYVDTAVSLKSPTHRSSAVIKNNADYSFKNLRTNLYADVMGSRKDAGTHVQQAKFTFVPNQIFKAIYNKTDASFSFVPRHAPEMRLGFEKQSSVHLTIQNAADTAGLQAFNPTYLHSGQYRIMTGIINKKEAGGVLQVSADLPIKKGIMNAGQYIGSSDFNPDSMNQYWYIERKNV